MNLSATDMLVLAGAMTLLAPTAAVFVINTSKDTRLNDKQKLTRVLLIGAAEFALIIGLMVYLLNTPG